MNDYINKHVKLLLNNNIIIEGTVKSWSFSTVEILSLDNKSTSIITHPNEDIRVIKIVHQEKNIIEEKTATEQEFDSVSNEPGYDDLKLKKLSELKIEMIKQDKEIVASQLKNHQIGELKKVNYEYPGFFKK
jgi:hypothetical protein